MEQYGVPYESGQVMTEERLGYLDHLNVRSSYSESKRLCECYCKSYAVEYGVPAVIARLAQTFGPGVPVSDNRVFMQFTKVLLNMKILFFTQKAILCELLLHYRCISWYFSPYEGGRSWRSL